MAARNAESYNRDYGTSYQETDPRIADADRQLAGDLAAAMEDHRTDPATDPAETSHSAREMLLWKAAWRNNASELGDPQSEETLYAADDRRAMGFALESTETADRQMSELRRFLQEPQAADEETKTLTARFTEYHGGDCAHELKMRLDYAEAVKNTGRQLVYEGLRQADDEASSQGLAMIRSAENGLQEALEDPATAGMELGRRGEQLQYDASRLNSYQNHETTAATELIHDAGIHDPLTQQTVDTVMTRHAAAIAAYNAYENMTGYVKGNITEGPLQEALLQLSTRINPDSYSENHAASYVAASDSDLAAMAAHERATSQYSGLAHAAADNQKDLERQAHWTAGEAARELFDGNQQPMQHLIDQMTIQWAAYKGPLTSSITDSLKANTMHVGHQTQDYMREVAGGTDPQEAYQLHGVDLERDMARLTALNSAARIYELHLSTNGRHEAQRRG